MAALRSLLALAVCAGPGLIVLACHEAKLSGPQLERGEAVWERACVQCHDADAGIGSRLTDRVLQSYTTAELLYRYNRRFMPYGAEASLADSEYWDVTAYLLARYGFEVPEGELTPANAATITLTGR